MTSPLFPILMVILAIGLSAALAQAGINPREATASFWALVAVAGSMALVGFLWGKES